MKEVKFMYDMWGVAFAYIVEVPEDKTPKSDSYPDFKCDNLELVPKELDQC